MLSLVSITTMSAILPLVHGATMAVIADPVGVVQCLPYTFTWTVGTPPYDMSVYDAQSSELFNVVTNDTNATWTPVNGVGATADSPVEFNVLIQDGGPFSVSRSTAENITAGSIAVDSSGRCANAPALSSQTTTSATAVTAPISNSASTTFIPTTIKGASKADSGATNSVSTISSAPTNSNGVVSVDHRGSLLLGTVFGVFLVVLQ
ncbi:hypothetical protein DFH08DRAFT_878043 [Mycena albidolilacea]|uniref:Uncharacterized protein n=1 Tax=Mycena albidolilacea TaxID=1033008 RepID=A0AAD7EKY3_9AGAR|nr:hypothetical protein DFH08DRAFT_878043 [Mycena albidolilacea]